MIYRDQMSQERKIIFEARNDTILEKDFQPSSDHQTTLLVKRRPSSSICSNLNNLFVTLNLSTAADSSSVAEDEETLSLTSSDQSYQTEEDRIVRFGSVEIREYSTIQGDHPECKGGLALSLGWKYKTLGNFGIKELEDRKELLEDSLEDDDDDDDSCVSRASAIYIKKPRKLNYYERRLILEQVGFIVGDGHGRSRHSVWIGFDDHYMPDI
mmetsp:Transcript_27606/g.40767  ORF Transcript_27606/g.40767 Transcript_27606/m.40767 type:complete len:212 (+) Transcript_27606:96-731(+)